MLAIVCKLCYTLVILRLLILRTLAMATKTDPFKTVTSHLGELSVEELEGVARMVATLLTIRREEEEVEIDQAADDDTDQGAEKKTARGHIELKLINGYGPYQYLRYWEGKTLKSRYIGKAKS